MNVLVCCLTYGNRPLDIIHNNLERAGFPFHVRFVNVEGIANALNEGIDMLDDGDYLAFLANDIIEPDNWLAKKLIAAMEYPNAGIVASSLGEVKKEIKSEHIISNWLISKDVIHKIGIFNESMFPYGPIDLDYCERANVAGFGTYYVMDCMAEHIGSHASGNEYGYDKSQMVAKYWGQYKEDIKGYNEGHKSIVIKK